MEGAWVGPLHWIQWAGGAAASFPAGGGAVREAVERLPDMRMSTGASRELRPGVRHLPVEALRERAPSRGRPEIGRFSPPGSPGHAAVISPQRATRVHVGFLCPQS